MNTAPTHAASSMPSTGWLSRTEAWLDARGINQAQLYNDNSVLRGQKPRVDVDRIE